jgi:hypothetical protein
MAYLYLSFAKKSQIVQHYAISLFRLYGAALQAAGCLEYPAG